MNANLAERLHELPFLLGGHMVLSVAALAVGIAISLPLGVVSAFSRRAQAVFLTGASILQTIPGLALLALMVPLLGGTIGFLPAFLALMLYSILPILRNTVTGIAGVPEDAVEAANGVGMTRTQVLLTVQLPLAVPVILAGIRTATVWVVGTATLSTPVGAPSLGNYIFMGLQTRNQLAILFGCVFAAILAIVLDQLIRLAEIAIRKRRRGLLGLAVAGLSAILIGGLAPALVGGRAMQPAGSARTTTQKELDQNSGVRAEAPDASTRAIRVGSKPFTEQYILVDLITRRLGDDGFAVEKKPNMGSTILFDALRNDEIDCYVDYSGTIWATVMKRGETESPEAVLIDMASYLKDTCGVISLGPLGFENAYCLAMRRDRADALEIQTIGDLASHAQDLKIAGDYEFFGRSEWKKVRDVYGIDGIEQVGMDPTLMYEAVKAGQVDVISAYTTDGRIPAYDLVILEDPEMAFPPYDAVLLLSPRAAKDRKLVNTLMPLINSITNEEMQEANRMVDLEKKSTGDAAQFLARPDGREQ